MGDADAREDRPPPPVLFRGSALEVVRWPLTEKVGLVLDTDALYVERGTLLAMIRGGRREVSLPLADITTVDCPEGSTDVTIDAGAAGTVRLSGDEALLIATMLWALGVPGRPVEPVPDQLQFGPATLQRTGVSRAGTVVLGPAGLGFSPAGLLQSFVGGGVARLGPETIRSARVERRGVLLVDTKSGPLRLATDAAPGLLQRLRPVLATTDLPDAAAIDAAGRVPLARARERLAEWADAAPPLEDPGDLLVAGPGIWTPDEDHAARALAILGSERLTLLPDDPALPPWQEKTGRLRRGDALNEDTTAGLLRVAARNRSTIFRPLGGAPFVQAFWSAAAPYQFVVPGEDFDPEPWRGIAGPGVFLRFLPDDGTEVIYRPAFLIARQDGTGVVLPPSARWPWHQGAFLRAEVSRPRGVFKFAAQYLRFDPDGAIPAQAWAHLGLGRDVALKQAVLMPGPQLPELQPPKRALLRLPTDEPVRIVVRRIAADGVDEDDEALSQGDRLAGRLADLSAGGCAVQLDRAIPTGSQVIVLPDGARDRHQFRAEVMALRLLPESARLVPSMEYELGLRFMGLNEARLSWLQREVLHRQRKRLAIRAAAPEDADPDALPLLDRPYHA